MSKKILGLDIQHDGLSAVLITSGIRENEIESFAHMPLSRSENQEDEEPTLTEALNMIREKIDINGAVCTASFPPDRISYRNIKVPFHGNKKISQVLPFELESLLPLPVQDLIIDFHTVTFPDSTGDTEVFTVAASKTDVNRMLNAMKAANMEPSKISIGSYCMALNLPDDVSGDKILLDFGNSRCTLYIMAFDQICLVRSFPFHIIRKNAIDSLCRHLKQSIGAYEELFSRNFTPEILYITGYGSSELNTLMEEEIGRKMAVSTERPDLIRQSGSEIRSDAASWRPALMDNALALALAEANGKNGLNLRKGELAVQTDWARYKKPLITVGSFMMVILILLLFNFIRDSSVLNNRLAMLDKQIEEVFKAAYPESKIIAPVHQMQEGINKLKKETLLSLDSVRVIAVLTDISKRIPENTDVKFTRMVMTPKDVLIWGNADSNKTVDEVQSKLSQSDIFNKITLGSIEEDRKTNRRRFKMKAYLNNLRP